MLGAWRAGSGARRPPPNRTADRHLPGPARCRTCSSKGKASPYRDYDAYAAKLLVWKGKRDLRPDADLATGSFVYHGTTKATALIVKAASLTPARPEFRGGVWDASRDGFLSVATSLTGVTVAADSIILRMTVQAGDQASFGFKVISKTEIVTRNPILPARLEWAAPVKGKEKDKLTWKPMRDLV